MDFGCAAWVTVREWWRSMVVPDSITPRCFRSPGG